MFNQILGRLIARFPWFWDVMFIACCALFVLNLGIIINEILSGKWARKVRKEKIESIAKLPCIIYYAIYVRFFLSGNLYTISWNELFQLWLPVGIIFAWDKYYEKHSRKFLKIALDKLNANHIEDAIVALDKSIEMNNNNRVAYSYRGIINADKGDLENSLKDLDKSILLFGDKSDHPDLPFVYKNRGITKNQLEDLKGACEDWKKAAELGDEDAAELLKEHCEG